MTLLDALRPGTADSNEERRPLAPWLVGLMVAGSSLLGLLLISVLGWATSTPRGTGFGAALGFGSDVWLLAQGARLGVADGHIALTPLVLTAALLWAARRGALSVVRSVEDEGPLWRGVIETGRARALGLYLAGHVAIGLVAYALTYFVAVRPTLSSLVFALVGMPLLGVVLALTRHVDEVDDASWWAGLGIPQWLRRVVPAGIRGALLAVGLGSALVVVGVLVHLDRVAHVSGEVGATGFGVVLLWLGQGLVLPNVGLWGLSFVAGPGYTLVEGSTVTLGGASGSVLPLIPVYAASPQPGSFPGLTVLLVLVPVLLGLRIGVLALRAVPRLSRMRTKLAAAAAAGLVSAVLVGALDAFAGGSLGSFRLADIGAPALWLTLVLAVEFVVGALLAVLWDIWRLHTR